MNHDPRFRAECAAFVQVQLGTHSDDACAYVGCAECGKRWGELTPHDQMRRKWCPHCLAPGKGESVMPHLPSWYGGRPDNYVPGFFEGIGELVAELEEDDEPEDAGPTWKERGEMVHVLATRYREKAGKKICSRAHIHRAIAKVRKDLAKAGIDIDDETLKKDRRRYADTTNSSRRYAETKRKQKQ
jgi:hypothetical protein